MKCVRRARMLGVALAVIATGACGHSRDVAHPPPSALPLVDVDTSGVPFAPTPEGLLRPGAAEAVQGALVERGVLQTTYKAGLLDPPTREALRRFQASRDLPATGLPSYRTVEALGLEVDRVFFSSGRPPTPKDTKPEKTADSKTSNT